MPGFTEVDEGTQRSAFYRPSTKLCFSLMLHLHSLWYVVALKPESFWGSCEKIVHEKKNKNSQRAWMAQSVG